jgi:menaquinol-cytochrome c reductase iron-sulfur subunit
MQRRHLLLVAGAAATSVGVAAAPAVVALGASSKSSGGGRWVRTVALASLREGEKKRVTIVADARDAWTRTPAEELGTVWLVRRGDTVLAFSAVCPHLGCAVSGKGAGEGFVCLCHDSHFAESGDAQHGPSPRGLDPLATRMVGEIVEVDFRRFRPGSRERVEVG